METVSIIAAMDELRGIGFMGKIPWHLPADLAHFKQVTTGHAVIMGRKTYESIGRPLPRRQNIILSRQPEFRAPGCDLAYSLEDAIRMVNDGEAFVIGGAQVYRDALPLATRLYLTHVKGQFEADTYFPRFDRKQWRAVAGETLPADDRNAYQFAIEVLERVSDQLPDGHTRPATD